eukprot:TRINITY_DN1199_c1_g1_i1.p2 TRINITY_DN1199_c1_g1~~TRINITY_DN1199_c1_g1_i1.p2  ORF type:complete len:411 (+),score=40.28 TRINITY_DN1199_c1_g1_i1:112-1344(+)
MNFNFAQMVCYMLLLGFSFGAKVNPPGFQLSELSQIQTRFGLKMMETVCSDKNCVFSPYSIYNVLGMVLMAAGGNTEGELMNALNLAGIFENDQELHESIGEIKQFLLQGAIQTNDTELDLADNIYVGDIYPVSPQYIDDLQWYYHIDGPYTQDFTNAQQSADTINQFVEEQTQGQITEMFQPDMFTINTLAVLVNAIYFNASWETPFQELLTHYSNFYINSTTVVNVTMMEHKSHFRHLMEGDTHILELPYSNNDFAMYVISPKTIFNQVRDRIINDPEFVQKTDAQLQYGHIIVNLPRFSLAGEIDLKRVLQDSFNVSDLFTEGVADLFGAVPDGFGKSPYVSEALHKASIDVMEYGTVASGATGVVNLLEIGAPRFLVDSPFMYMVVYKPTWTVLFMGQVVDPTQTE